MKYLDPRGEVPEDFPQSFLGGGIRHKPAYRIALM